MNGSTRYCATSRSATIARREPPKRHGLGVVDKAAGWTSHDVVARARKVLGERRVGHSGTLDPDATGVLLLGVGSVTRLLRYLTALPKTYTCEIVCGVETDTLDAGGVVVASYEMGGLDIDAVRRASQSLIGAIDQVPPMVSAVHHEGRRLHELAREGIEVERAARPVTVHRFVLAPTADPLVYTAEVECSSGTYVRVLAADLGKALGGGAHLRSLRRTAIGSFTVAEAQPVESLILLDPPTAMRDYSSLMVDDDTARLVAHGRPIEAPAEGEGPWAVHSTTGRLLAVYERAGDMVKPSVVLSDAGETA